MPRVLSIHGATHVSQKGIYSFTFTRRVIHLFTSSNLHHKWDTPSLPIAYLYIYIESTHSDYQFTHSFTTFHHASPVTTAIVRHTSRSTREERSRESCRPDTGWGRRSRRGWWMVVVGSPESSVDYFCILLLLPARITNCQLAILTNSNSWQSSVSTTIANW